jgi:hypothetical protein
VPGGAPYPGFGPELRSGPPQVPAAPFMRFSPTPAPRGEPQEPVPHRGERKGDSYGDF